MAQEDYIIQVRGLHKAYRTGTITVEALRGVDFTARRGEMVAIMGPSGCGKTTLLNCLSGLDDINKGEVVVEGEALHRLSDNDRTDFRARRMGFVFQLYNLLPVLSAVENVELPLLVAGAPPRDSRALALESLTAVGLADVENRRPAALSGGQRQRVTIARALVNKPAVIWADEPTGDLDSETANEVMEIFSLLNKVNGQTFIMVTHSNEVASRADRIVTMRDGLIVEGN
jgi:putative ABC transport system ATP-binding protein